MHKEFKILIAHTFVHRLLLQISRFFKIIFFCACATLCELETEIITVTHVPKLIKRGYQLIIIPLRGKLKSTCLPEQNIRHEVENILNVVTED